MGARPRPTPRQLDRAQDRYRKLVADLLEERGNAHGSKKEVAALLRLTPEHLSRVVSGARRVGWSAMREAADVLDFDVAYFVDDAPRGTPSFTDYRTFESKLTSKFRRPIEEPSHETVEALRHAIARFRKNAAAHDAHVILRDAERWLRTEIERAQALHAEVLHARDTALGDAKATDAARALLLPIEAHLRQLRRDVAPDDA